VRSGLVPPLARGFSIRYESVPDLEQVLVPGRALVLAPAQAAKAPGWQAATGRTQLAVYAAQSLGWPGGLDLVAWVTAASRATILSGYAEAASRLGLDQSGTEAAAARFAAWLRSTPRPWLVVLDDLRDRADLEGLWPAGAAGRLLITAADPETAGDGAEVLPTGCLTPREALQYLSVRLSADPDPDSRTGQLDLALALGGEPAALAHAAAVIETSELTCRDYQEIFMRERAGLERPDAGPVPAGAVTWRLSAHHAEILDPGGGTWPLLVLAALLHGHGIPLTVLTAPAICGYLGGDGPAGAELTRSAVRALGSAGLLDLDEDGTLMVARVSGALRESVLAVAPELLEQAAGPAADALIEAWPKDQPESPLAVLLRSCTASLLEAAGDALWAGGRCHRVLVTAGQSLDAAALPGPAATWWQQVTEGSARLLGPRHPDTVAAAGLLAGALMAAGQADGAVTWAQWVLAAHTEVLGPDHRGTVAPRTALGRALTAAGRLPEAIRVLEETARHSERVCGPGDDATLTALEEQAAAYQAAGQPRDAARLLKRALDGREKSQGPADPATLATGDRLAAAFQAAGQYRDATRLSDKLLACCEHALGPDHPGTLAALTRLAGACGTAGQVSTALRHYQRATAGYGQVLGAGHPVTLRCQGELARAYYDAGHAGDAVTLLRAAITAAGQALSPDDPVTAVLRGLLDEITDEMTAR
jgi:tetratricopeptide (TPR) repeat protein